MEEKNIVNDSMQYKKRSQFKSVVKRFVKNKTAMIGLFVFLAVLCICIFSGLYMDYNNNAIHQDLMVRFQGPSAEHWFGTDQYGRDLFARVIFGGRTSLVTAMVVIFVATMLGSLFGSLAGYYGGMTDMVIMRIADVFYSIPYTLMAVCIVSSLGGGMVNLAIACIVAVTPANIRLFRSWVMPLKNQDYIDAAKAYGTKNRRILTKHIIPNTLGPIVVQATLQMAITIIEVAGLSYIGLGVQAPAPEWGAMLSEARQYMRDYPYLVLLPGCAILISTLALNLVGDGFRDALDPKLKN